MSEVQSIKAIKSGLSQQSNSYKEWYERKLNSLQQSASIDHQVTISSFVDLGWRQVNRVLGSQLFHSKRLKSK